MNKSLKEFIESNIDLIENNQWETVYDRALSKLSDSDIGQFTKIFLDANIHPENYLSYLPNYFLYGTSIKNFEIPSSITSINRSAFYDCSSLTSITIPDSVTAIGYSAFSSCSSLTSISIGNSVTSIGGSAFAYCESIKSIMIPDSVTNIGYGAFYNCTSLISMTIPNSVTSISDSTFAYCISLASVTIPDGVTDIGDYAFDDCSNHLIIKYNGSKSDWKQIYNSKAFVNTYFTCHCTDGKIVKKRR